MNWKFWKKDDDFGLGDFKMPSADPNLSTKDASGLDLSTHFDSGTGSSAGNSAFPPINSPGPAFANPAGPAQGPSFNQMYPLQQQTFPSSFAGGNPVQQLNAAQFGGNEEQHSAPHMGKDLEVIAAKLDTIRAQLDMVNARLSTIEERSRSEQAAAGVKRPWY